MRNGHIVQEDVKFLGTCRETRPDLSKIKKIKSVTSITLEMTAHCLGDLFSLCDQMLCIVLSHDGLDHFRSNRRQHSFVPVQSQRLSR